jgi:hypothetical protein
MLPYVKTRIIILSYYEDSKPCQGQDVFVGYVMAMLSWHSVAFLLVMVSWVSYEELFPSSTSILAFGTWSENMS